MARIFPLLLLFLGSLAAQDRPNVLFILADDLGWSDTTLYGQTSFYQTPNLERLAARGMTFDRAYTASPLCSPTRSSILTGLHPARTGLTSPNCHRPQIILKARAEKTAPPAKKLTAYHSVTRLDPKYKTISKRLRQEGYATGHFGKWHLGAEPYSPLEHGFDVDIPHWHGPGPAGSFVAPWKFENFKEKYPKEHIEDRMGDEAVAFMEAAKDKPFFLNYWQFSVHAPFDAKKAYIERYRKTVNLEDEQRSPTYAAMVQSLDDNVGKMLDALDRLKIADKTVIVFFSDNGGNMYNEVDGTTPTSNRPLRGGKGNNWDGGVRVPAVVVWPGKVAAGSRSSELITSTDFYPTLLDICGMQPTENQQFDGVSIVPALKGRMLQRENIFTWFPHSTGVPDTLPPSAAIYGGDWKLFRFFHDGPQGAHRHALYNLKNDIGETTDLSAENPDQAAAMIQKLDKFIADTGAVFPLFNPDYAPSANGISAVKDCRISVKDGRLLIQTSGRDPKISAKLKPQGPAGDLVLRLKFTEAAPGVIDLRWAENGVTPIYFNDRMERVRPKGKDVDISFSAKQPVTSFRIDFPNAAKMISVDEISLLKDGKNVYSWKF